jgi:ATP-dependent phosphoenolpyruvate carboxykinase
MMRTDTEMTVGEESLGDLGLLNIGNVHWDSSTPVLYEEAIRRYEGMVAHLGPLVIRTGQYTGRLGEAGLQSDDSKPGDTPKASTDFHREETED